MIFLTLSRRGILNSCKEKLLKNNVRSLNTDPEDKKETNNSNPHQFKVLNDKPIHALFNTFKVCNINRIGIRNITQSAILRSYDISDLSIHSGDNMNLKIDLPSILQSNTDELEALMSDFRRDGPSPSAIMPALDSTYDEFNLEEEDTSNDYESEDDDEDNEYTIVEP